MSKARHVVAVAVSVGCGFGLVLWATTHGFGVTPDSVAYLGGATSLSAGSGYVLTGFDGAPKPITHFPPGYSATMAPLIALGLRPLLAAKALSLALLAANVILIAYAAYHFTAPTITAVIVAFFVAFSPQLLFIHTAAWSEQEFVFLVLASLLALSAYLEERGRRFLVASAAAAALACLCRIVGVALVGTGLFCVAILGPGSLRTRWRHAGLFGVLALAPLLAWSARNKLLAGEITSRRVEPATLSTEHLEALLNTVSSWWIPGSDRIEVFAGQDLFTNAATSMLFAIFALAIVRFVGPRLDGRRTIAETPVVFLVFAAMHVGAVLGAISFWDEAVTLDSRVLVPAFVGTVVVSAWVLQRAAVADTAPFWRVGCIIFVGGVLVANTLSGLVVAQYFHRTGRGFNSPQWHYPAIGRELASIAPSTLVLTNHRAAVNFLWGFQTAEASPAEARQAGRNQRNAIILYFDLPRAYPPRKAAAVRMDSSSPERRENLVGSVGATLILNERNAWMYRLAPLGDGGSTF